MTIAAIPSIPAIPTLPSVTAPGATSPVAGSDAFSSVITNAVDALQQAQANATSAEAQAASGQGNLADTMIAASKASLDTQVTTDLLNKALTSYTSIMSMNF